MYHYNVVVGDIVDAWGACCISLLLWGSPFLVAHDHTYDTAGVSKLQWTFSGPHTILRKSAQCDDLYYIRTSTPGGSKDVKANVNRLFLATNECEALGFPALGWETTELAQAQPTQLPAKLPTTILRDNIVVNDFVILRVAADIHEALPFAVGKVIGFPSGGDNNKVEVWWYGPVRKLTGSWKPGYIDPKDNKRYYRDTKLRREHTRYTSHGNCELVLDDIVGVPFTLHKCIPKSILRMISEDKTVNWSIPETV